YATPTPAPFLPRPSGVPATCQSTVSERNGGVRVGCLTGGARAGGTTFPKTCRYYAAVANLGKPLLRKRCARNAVAVEVPSRNVAREVPEHRFVAEALRRIPRRQPPERVVRRGPPHEQGQPREPPRASQIDPELGDRLERIEPRSRQPLAVPPLPEVRLGEPPRGHVMVDDHR